MSESMLNQISLPAWILENRIKTEAGKELDLASHLFLYDIYTDDSKKIVCLKAAQIGFSTLAIIKTLWLAKMKGLSMAYTLPTFSDAQEFVRTKVNRLIAANPILRAYVKEGDNMSDKTVGNATIFYRGSFAEKQAISFTADLLCFDEVDRSDQSVLSVYASRLQHSDFKGEYYFSNPSVPGNGVDKFWQKSDQKHWFITCKSCQKEQYLSWPDSIDPIRECYQCKACSAELSNEERRVGRWVKKKLEAEFSGYWISLLMAPWVTAKEILEYEKTKSPEYFANFVLGLPYVGEDMTITREMLKDCLTDEVNKHEGQIVIGLDTGTTLWYVVGNQDGVFYNSSASDYNEIRALMRRWPRAVLVIDQGGDLIEPRKLLEEFQGRVYLCHYRRDRKRLDLVTWGEGDESGNVVVDRNRMIDLIIGELKEQRIQFNGTESDWLQLFLHAEAIYAVKEENSLGVMEKRWERSGADHLLHALLYWRVGMSRFASQGAILGADIDLSGIQKGYAVAPNDTVSLDLQKLGEKKRHDWRLV